MDSRWPLSLISLVYSLSFFCIVLPFSLFKGLVRIKKVVHKKSHLHYITTAFPPFLFPLPSLSISLCSVTINTCKRSMGNCIFGGLGEAIDVCNKIKVETSNGGIMEFHAPITVECITDEFQGHGIFRSRDLFWKPLPLHKVLLKGESYYLLPLNNTATASATGQIAKVGHIRPNKTSPDSVVAPYRMSFDCQGTYHSNHKRSYTEAFSRYSSNNCSSSSNSSSNGVWKVKLVISPQQLVDILSREAATQELIESVRTVAKCGNGNGNGVSSGGFSDQWSLSSSSRNASSKKDCTLDF